jgi:hypothetical protein
LKRLPEHPCIFFHEADRFPEKTKKLLPKNFSAGVISLLQGG